MQLTKQTDYSLRVLMYLGLHGDRLATVKEIRETYQLSKGHLMKIVNELGRAGFIETVRGRNGGIRLARDPNELNLETIVRFTEHNLELVECFQADGNRCPLTRMCTLSTALDRALEAFFDVLNEYTLADLIAKPDRMRDTLRRNLMQNTAL